METAKFVRSILIIAATLIVGLLIGFSISTSLSNSSNKNTTYIPTATTSTVSPTITATTVPTSTPSNNAFKVTSIDITANPTSIAGLACGNDLTVTYSAIFHISANTQGGTVAFTYTTNNGRSSTPANLNVSAGETEKTYTFSVSGNLYPDHTFPGIAEIIASSPNIINSSQVQPSGACH